MRARLIVNPVAGADRAMGQLPHLNARLATLVRDLDVTITTDGSDAERAAARAAEQGYDAIYVAGGDGTLNAALRGLASVAQGFDLPVGVIPFGTGNDFAKALGLGEDPEAALEALLDPHIVQADVGMLNDRPFVNVSAGGFVAEVSEIVTDGLKDRTGKLAYVIGGARALFGTHPFAARIEVPPGADVDLGGWRGTEVALVMFAVCNAPMIGGGYPVAPGAEIDDGLLDVFLVREMPTLEFIGVLQKIAAGEHHDEPRILQFRAPEFALEFNRTVRVNTDGEPLETDSCRYTMRHRAAQFFCGASTCTIDPPRRWSPDHSARR